jgi:hypothetical protein
LSAEVWGADWLLESSARAVKRFKHAERRC